MMRTGNGESPSRGPPQSPTTTATPGRCGPRPCRVVLVQWSPSEGGVINARAAEAAPLAGLVRLSRLRRSDVIGGIEWIKRLRTADRSTPEVSRRASSTVAQEQCHPARSPRRRVGRRAETADLDGRRGGLRATRARRSSAADIRRNETPRIIRQTAVFGARSRQRAR